MTDDMEKDLPADSEIPQDEVANDAADSGAEEAVSPSEDAAAAAVADVGGEEPSEG